MCILYKYITCDKTIFSVPSPMTCGRVLLKCHGLWMRKKSQVFQPQTVVIGQRAIERYFLQDSVDAKSALCPQNTSDFKHLRCRYTSVVSRFFLVARTFLSDSQLNYHCFLGFFITFSRKISFTARHAKMLRDWIGADSIMKSNIRTFS